MPDNSEQSLYSFSVLISEMGKKITELSGKQEENTEKNGELERKVLTLELLVRGEGEDGLKGAIKSLREETRDSHKTTNEKIDGLLKFMWVMLGIASVVELVLLPLAFHMMK